MATADPRPTWLRWLHRFGNASTAALLLGGLFLALSVVSRPSSPIIKGREASFDGTLDEAMMHWNRESANYMLASLPDQSALGRWGIRVIIMPSFSDWFGLVIHADSRENAMAVLSRQQPPPWNPEGPLPPVEIERWTFHISAEDYAEFMRWFDAWAEEYGHSEFTPCIDGTSVYFERVNGTVITSGRGNCERHYDLLRQHLLAFVKRHHPDAAVGLHPDWHEIER